MQNQQRIRGRFTLQSTEEHAAAGEGECHINVRFTAVTATDEDNKKWSKLTPSGELTMTITNPDARDGLKVGHDYYLDLTKVV